MSKTWYGHYIMTEKGQDYVKFEDYLELEQRIDKAIEYIESKSFSENFEFHSNEWAVRRELL